MMISPQLTEAVAHARTDDLRRAADAHRTVHGADQAARPVAIESSVTLRLASTSDEKSLARLAELDSAGPQQRPVLVAELDGQLLAALSLSDGRAVANPFHPTADLVDLLRARAQHIRAQSPTKRCGRLRSWARLCPPTRIEPISAATPAR